MTKQNLIQVSQTKPIVLATDNPDREEEEEEEEEESNVTTDRPFNRTVTIVRYKSSGIQAISIYTSNFLLIGFIFFVVPSNFSV